MAMQSWAEDDDGDSIQPSERTEFSDPEDRMVAGDVSCDETLLYWYFISIIGDLNTGAMWLWQQLSADLRWITPSILKTGMSFFHLPSCSFAYEFSNGYFDIPWTRYMKDDCKLAWTIHLNDNMTHTIKDALALWALLQLQQVNVTIRASGHAR